MNDYSFVTESFFELFFPVFILLCSILLGLIVYTVISAVLFRKTTYHRITHNGFFSTRLDTGKYGEYLSYKRLQKYEKSGGKFLFNLYLTKDNGETTELDVVLIHSKGIFVIESKNYSGWIFGKEKQKMWTQTLPQGKGRASKKEHFLNPIMQNKLHIKALKSVIGEEIPIYSVVAFSERCTLKDVAVYDEEIKVVNRNNLLSAVKDLSALTKEDISQSKADEITDILYPFSQVSENIKKKHIENIKPEHNETAVLTESESAEKIAPPEEPQNSAVSGNEEPSENTESSNEISISETKSSGENKTDDEIPKKCPDCGGELILRTAKRGKNSGNQFYGCSNYPKCRYIKNI